MTRSALDCPSCGHRAKPDDAYCSDCGFPVGQLREVEDALVGKTLAGGYRIVDRLAEGSMGQVYRAEQSNLGRAVAVKVMSPNLVVDEQMVARFRNEARAASSLNHPNCVRVYDYGETADGRPYLVMELLLGQELAELLQADRLQPVSRVLDIALQVLSALDEAHGLGVVHRDLKPENVFVLPQRGGGDLVKVVDFGLAKLRHGMSTTANTGQVFGTPEYMAPEQAMAKETDHRTDLYSCGVMLFEMLAGKLPFQADTARELLEKQVYDDPPKLTGIVPERVTFGLDEIVDLALRKDPAQRFQSAEAFAEALREVIAHRTGERSLSDRKSWVRQSLKSCTKCGNKIVATAKFCGECGEPAPRDSMVPSMRPGPSVSQQMPGAALRASAKPTIPELTETRARSLDQAIQEALDSGDANSALVFLEQIAAGRMAQGDPLSAIVALKRGIEVARADLDKGDLDDPIRAVSIFSQKLGDAYAAAMELRQAHHAFKDALALTRATEERAKIWRSLARIAREQGHEGDATEYLDAAEREESSHARKKSTNPSVRNLNRKRTGGGFR